MPGAVGLLLHHARRRLALRDRRTRAGSPTSRSTCSSRAPRTARPRATSEARSTASAASSTPSRARSTRATTSVRGRAPRPIALDVLVDMLRHSKFDPEEIEREKGVIIEEMNMYFDTPRDYIGGVYDQLLYGDQPLGWDIIGTQGDRPRGRRATRSSATSTAGTSPSGWSSGVGGKLDGDPLRDDRAAARRPRAGGDGRAGAGRGRGRTAMPRVKIHTRRPTRRTSASACRATRSTIPTATRSSCSRRCSAPGCRRGSSPRCASGAASPTTSTRQPQLHRRRLALLAGRRRHQARRRGGRDDRAELRKIADEAVPAEELEKARTSPRGASCSDSRTRRG